MILKNNAAFTLMEIITVIVIVGVISGFALTNFTKSVEKSHDQDAVMQLSTIHSAIKIYKARTGTPKWPTVNGQDLTTINTTLGLNIIANEQTYICNTDPDLSDDYFSCTSTRVGGSGRVFTVTGKPLDSSSGANQNPTCTSNC